MAGSPNEGVPWPINKDAYDLRDVIGNAFFCVYIPIYKNILHMFLWRHYIASNI